MIIVLTDTTRALLDTKKRRLPAPMIYRQANNDKLAIFLPDTRMSSRIQAWCGGGKKVRYNAELGAYIVLSKYLRQVSAGVAA